MPDFIKGVRLEEPPVRYRGERILSLLEKLHEGGSSNIKDVDFMDEYLAAAVYYLFFLPAPILAEAEHKDPRRAKQYALLRLLASSPKLSMVRRKTIADSTTSTVASAVFLEHLLRELSKNSESTRSSGGSREEGVRHSNRPSMSNYMLQQAVEKALEATHDIARQAREIKNLTARFTAGTGSILSLEDSVAEVLKLAKNTDVKIILEALRSIQDIDAYIKRRLVRSPRGELDGYELGSDVERIVPSELALPYEAFSVKLAESSLLLYRKVLPETRGPFHILLDKSGSMMGLKIIWAKAVAIALAQRAARERRPFMIRFFDSIPYPLMKIGKRVRGRDVVKMLEYLARIRANGGTDITRAILTATEDIASMKSFSQSDIVLITDGEDKIAIDAVRRSLARVKARLHTVMVHGNNFDLKSISTTYMTVTRLDKESALKVIVHV
ncbi:MAG: VWA domain-containing protein [Crenarchaeota archaeon]|nr:VWA domain-containing protein [Thermoproteota archaeon]